MRDLIIAALSTFAAIAVCVCMYFMIRQVFLDIFEDQDL